MIDHPAPPCPEGITDCSTDCPRYGRDCDGDDVVYVTGGVGDDGPADAPASTERWDKKLSAYTIGFLYTYSAKTGWCTGMFWLAFQCGFDGPYKYTFDCYDHRLRGHTNETD